MVDDGAQTFTNKALLVLEGLNIRSLLFDHLMCSMFYCHPLDGITNPEYKLLPFIQPTKCFCKEKKALGAAI